jgi:2-methylcitrate dehydratase PrpD
MDLMHTDLTPKLAGEYFAAHIAGAQLADLPEAAMRAAKIFILDTFGVGVAGSTAPGTEGILTASRGWGSDADAAVWGRRDRVPAPTAAFLNATQVHGQEYDCVHEPAVLHPLATLLPAAMAWADRQGGVSGADLLMAVAVGVDVSAGLGVASKRALQFFRPATSGGFGAVAAVARLAGLDANGVLSAFGMHYAQTSGTMQPHVEGSIVLPMQVGFNSRAAVTATDLAATGLVGPRDVFEGPYGYMPLFEGTWDLAPVLDSLGTTWRVAELSHKPYPAGRATHGGIEGVTLLRDEHGFTVDDVESVIVYGPPIVVRLCARPAFHGMTPTYARLSTPFAVANLLRHGLLDLSHYRGSALHDPATLEVASRISMVVDDNPDPNALVPQRVVVRLRSGTELEWHCPAMLANPARPLTRAQHIAKFHRCWEFAADPLSLDKRDTLIAMVDDLEKIADVRALSALLQP